MAPNQKQKLTIAFDLYGTLLDTASIATDLSTILGPSLLPPAKADELAAKWRQYQLEYTWRISTQQPQQQQQSSSSPTGDNEHTYIPFDALTRAALLHAAQELGLHLSPAKAAQLMTCYDSLQTFPEVLPALKTLAQRKDAVAAVVFSNGTEAMLARSVATAPTLKLFQAEEDSKDRVFEKLISVESTRRYKPAPEVYAHLQTEAVGAGVEFGKARAAVWLVSANAFDVIGARAAGVRAAWVDRKGTGWVDQLGVAVTEGTKDKKLELTPTLVVKGVDEAVEKILAVGV